GKYHYTLQVTTADGKTREKHLMLEVINRTTNEISCIATVTTDGDKNVWLYLNDSRCSKPKTFEFINGNGGSIKYNKEGGWIRGVPGAIPEKTMGYDLKFEDGKKVQCPRYEASIGALKLYGTCTWYQEPIPVK
ncbi:MAG: hypothetical protein ACREEM_21685, partial [Blastocatellia bacterium]